MQWWFINNWIFSDNLDSVSVSNKVALERVQTLLQVDKANLTDALTKKIIQVDNETVVSRVFCIVIITFVVNWNCREVKQRLNKKSFNMLRSLISKAYSIRPTYEISDPFIRSDDVSLALERSYRIKLFLLDLCRTFLQLERL